MSVTRKIAELQVKITCLQEYADSARESIKIWRTEAIKLVSENEALKQEVSELKKRS